MAFAPDFYEYFHAVAGLIEGDESLWLASAWNDNGFDYLVADPLALRRTRYFPGLGWLLRKRPQEVAPVRVAERAPVVKPTPPPARPAPVAKAPAPAPKPPAPRPPAPVTKVTPPPAPKPVTPPPAPRPLLSEPPKATIHTETTDHDVTTVVRYEESSASAETSARVTYENNALGDDQESVADKSDSVPD
jgi:outer membrane biosynthesis protein TonB